MTRTLLLVGLLALTCLCQDFREDGLCGPGNKAPNGKDAKCQHIPPFPTCCQPNGHCGWDCDNAAPVPDVGRPADKEPPPRTSAAKPVATPVFASNGKYRSDGRCGAEALLEDGTPAECDPNSEYWCCSAHGFCGGTQEHCYCETCINYRPVSVVGKVRSDRRCGAEFTLPDGSPSECDGLTANHCCSKWGFCGPAPDHCDCPGCVDYRGGVAKEVPLLVGKVRADRRCGPEFPLPADLGGGPAECDGSSPNPCCSKWGFCGPVADHCGCPTCVDYRSPEDRLSEWAEGGRWRKDRRCGKEFPLPDGSGEPGECNPAGENHCCSKWGFCGGDGEHCDCPECVDFSLASK